MALLRLSEGPIFFASFAEGMTLPLGSGEEGQVSGLFAALSFDEGETWPVGRLVTDGAPEHEVESTDGTPFLMSPTKAEPRGYLAACQARNGVIHLVSSRQHYAFNLAWLMAEVAVPKDLFRQILHRVWALSPGVG